MKKPPVRKGRRFSFERVADVIALSSAAAG